MAPQRRQHRRIRVMLELPQLSRLKVLIEQQPHTRTDMVLYYRIKKAHDALTKAPKWPDNRR